MYKVSNDGYWGILDHQGKAITPIKYVKIEGFENNRAKVYLNGKWGVIDREGKEIIKVN